MKILMNGFMEFWYQKSYLISSHKPGPKSTMFEHESAAPFGPFIEAWSLKKFGEHFHAALSRRIFLIPYSEKEFKSFDHYV